MNGFTGVRVFNIGRFAESLRMTRAARRVTCRSLEGISGISNAFLNQIENHHRIPAINKILWLCDWMGKDMEAFIDVAPGDPLPPSPDPKSLPGGAA